MSPVLLALALRCVLAGPHGVDSHVVPLPPVIVEGQAPASEPAPASAPGGEPIEPPTEPAPAAAPPGLSDLPRQDTPPPPVEEALPPPPGFPLNLLPQAPLDGFWAYVLEVAAATGTAQLLSLAGCVPLIGPVAYAVVAPSVIVHAIERSARAWTTTGPGSRDAALLTAHLVEGVAGLFMLAGQALLLSEAAAIALLVTGVSSHNAQTASLGGVLLAGSAMGGLGLLGLMPAAVVIALAGPHLEVLAYRYLGSARDVEAGPVEGALDDDTPATPDGATAPATSTRGTP